MNLTTKPEIYKFYKPKDITSYDVIRKLKRGVFKGVKKIGHFGTLDPFAEGLLLIAINSATRLNNYVHDELSKTYVSYGILGIETPTGDLTSEVSNTDETDYLKNEISSFSKDFIEEKLRKKYLGEYWQAPHAFSASKFQGRKMYEYAREGVEIKKEKKKRYIHDIKVIEYTYPKLVIEFQVSSGTYIRTLFSDCARYLGTLGTLEGLFRSTIGSVDISNEQDLDNIHLPAHKVNLEKLLPYDSHTLEGDELKRLKHGNPVDIQREDISRLCWIKNVDKEYEGLVEANSGVIKPIINF